MASPLYREWRRCPHRQPILHPHHHHCLHHHRHRHHHHRHHHHCYHFFPPCAHHNHHLHSPFQENLKFSLPLPQKPDSFIPLPIRNNPNVGAAEYQEANSSAAQISQELEHLELDEEEDDVDEPIFVLTDEWRDFFAKSEARRRLEKKQSKKKGKKM
ncbi:hypothetical protein L6164_003117 [Bauhinia variegata]|uniref:Uncharacterized protein n=1 Tax=Bauhinia variegata TaxID=167791 RepID=A0ACB9Q5T4_BAUVA|nr:hypothetical protein L6164_003117 [Bauhinia variegata]